MLHVGFFMSAGDLATDENQPAGQGSTAFADEFPNF